MICLIVVSHIRTLCPKKTCVNFHVNGNRKAWFFFLLLFSRNMRNENFQLRILFLLESRGCEFPSDSDDVDQWRPGSSFFRPRHVSVNAWILLTPRVVSLRTCCIDRLVSACMRAVTCSALSRSSAAVGIFSFLNPSCSLFNWNKNFLLSFTRWKIKNFELSNKFSHFVLIFDERSADV